MRVGKAKKQNKKDELLSNQISATHAKQKTQNDAERLQPSASAKTIKRMAVEIIVKTCVGDFFKRLKNICSAN